jgi:hypothetical protein
MENKLTGKSGTRRTYSRVILPLETRQLCPLTTRTDVMLGNYVNLMNRLEVPAML